MIQTLTSSLRTGLSKPNEINEWRLQERRCVCLQPNLRRSRRLCRPEKFVFRCARLGLKLGNGENKPKTVPPMEDKDKLACLVCGRLVVAKCTVDVGWRLCDRHALSAACCAFYPRYLDTRVVMTPQVAAEIKKELKYANRS